MQITNSPKDIGKYGSEFHEVLVDAVQHALGLNSFIADIKASAMYGPKLEAAACIAGWDLKVPTPIAFAALAMNQLAWSKKAYGKLELALSREKRDRVHEWETIAAYCWPTLKGWHSPYKGFRLLTGNLAWCHRSVRRRIRHSRISHCRL